MTHEQAAATMRDQLTRGFTMPANDRIERDVFIAADAARVWAVLTGPEHIGMWFGNGEPAEVDLRPGGRVVFDHGDGSDYGGGDGDLEDSGRLPATIERVDEPWAFAFRWTAGGPGGRAPNGTRVTTLVEFTLAPEDGGTRLRVVESGFAKVDAGDPPAGERRYQANAGGWGRTIRGLAAYAAAPDEDQGPDETESLDEGDASDGTEALGEGAVEEVAAAA
jgi:uncharacterized protein YndB with AHSA1/START domain